MTYFLPSWRQFRAWSLPSKYGFYGLIISFIPLVQWSIFTLWDEKEFTSRQVWSELSRNAECLEYVAFYGDTDQGCSISLDAAKGYVKARGDWAIMRGSFNEGVFSGVLEELSACGGSSFKIYSVESLPHCATLSKFDYYYHTRFLGWLLIPYVNQSEGMSLNLDAYDIEQDVYPYLDYKKFGSKLEVVADGRPVPFIEHID